MDVFYKRNGLRKFTASEYSDRVINLNKLEDRNLDNYLKYLDKEKNTSVTILDREIKKLKEEIDERQEKLREIYYAERLKLLNSNLHLELLLKGKNGVDKSKLINLLKRSKDSKNSKNSNVSNEQTNRLKKNLSANAKLNMYSNDSTNLVTKTKTYKQRPSSSFDSFDLSFIQNNIQPIKEPILDQKSRSNIINSSRSGINKGLSISANNLNSILPKSPLTVSGNLIKRKLNQKALIASSTESNLNFDIKIKSSISSPSSFSSKSSSPVPINTESIDLQQTDLDRPSANLSLSSLPNIKQKLNYFITDPNVNVKITELKHDKCKKKLVKHLNESKGEHHWK